MARFFDIHPANPQRRAIVQIADIVRAGGVIAYPTDSCYALGCQLGNRDGMARIRSIRGLGDRHHLTLVCQDFAQLGQFVYVANPVFRAIKAATPGYDGLPLVMLRLAEVDAERLAELVTDAWRMRAPEALACSLDQTGSRPSAELG